MFLGYFFKFIFSSWIYVMSGGSIELTWFFFSWFFLISLFYIKLFSLKIYYFFIFLLFGYFNLLFSYFKSELVKLKLAKGFFIELWFENYGSKDFKNCFPEGRCKDDHLTCKPFLSWWPIPCQSWSFCTNGCTFCEPSVLLDFDWIPGDWSRTLPRIEILRSGRLWLWFKFFYFKIIFYINTLR